MIWQELISSDFHNLDRRIPVLLPVAAVEQHGPHLPLATDRLIVEFLIAEIDARLGSAVLMLPTMPVGCSDHHMNFAGSLTLGQETFQAVAQQYLHAAWRHGFRNFLILNAHGGNQGVCQVLLERFGADHDDSQVVAATWWRVAPEALAALNETGMGGVGHACEFETSLMMHIAPHLVRRDAIEPKANIPTFDWAEGDLLRSPRAAFYRPLPHMTPNGAYGEPAAATAAKGARIVEVVCDALCEILTDLAASKQS